MTEELHLITFETEVYHQGLKIDLEVSEAFTEPGSSHAGVHVQGCQDKVPAGMVAVCSAWIYFSFSISEPFLPPRVRSCLNTCYENLY